MSIEEKLMTVITKHHEEFKDHVEKVMFTKEFDFDDKKIVITFSKN